MQERNAKSVIGLSAVTIGLATGCASNPVAPFDGFKSAPMTAYRLQNYEAPAQAATVPTAPGQIPGLPPEIQKWVQLGASALPPGLLPPGLIPGLGTAAAPAPVVDNTPRFHNFRVLGMPATVIDTKLRDELIDIFGFEKNFDDTHGNCVYAEFGFSFARVGQPPADVLVSLSCDQVQAQNFAWPHRSTGLTPDTVTRISKVSQAVFGG
ncbi:MAG TPA: hypothetical protein VJT73_15630 [Polyangiaceae bacterium]|nr:hypothetical protein [Polyangiaceae bacterium]